MPQIVAGTASALTKTISKMVKELLETNWPTSAYDPLASDIGFGLDTWDNYGDIDIHVTPDRTSSVPATIGWTYSKVTENVFITLYVRKNSDTVPDSFGAGQRMIEQIIKDHAASLGQGVTMLRFDGWDRLLVKDNLEDVWQCIGHAAAIYWLVKS